MPLTLEDIIAEADVRVVNSFSDAQKVTWLNEVNQEFFDVVKIPKTVSFTTINGTGEYTLNTDIRGKNIDLVHVGNGIFPSFLYDKVNPGTNYHTFNDDTHKITLSPTPSSVIAGIVRYHKIGITTFVSSGLTATPDAPAEYHWIYVLGLCERIAKAMDDLGKANNYANDYRNSLLIAQQNYKKTG